MDYYQEYMNYSASYNDGEMSILTFNRLMKVLPKVSFNKTDWAGWSSQDGNSDAEKIASTVESFQKRLRDGYMFSESEHIYRSGKAPDLDMAMSYLLSNSMVISYLTWFITTMETKKKDAPVLTTVRTVVVCTSEKERTFLHSPRHSYSDKHVLPTEYRLTLMTGDAQTSADRVTSASNYASGVRFISFKKFLQADGGLDAQWNAFCKTWNTPPFGEGKKHYPSCNLLHPLAKLDCDCEQIAKNIAHAEAKEPFNG